MRAHFFTGGTMVPHARIPATPKELVDFDDASGLHDGRFLLSLGEARRAFPIDINSRELLSVMVVDRNLPVTVLAAPIAPESRATLFGFFPGSLLH